MGDNERLFEQKMLNLIRKELTAIREERARGGPAPKASNEDSKKPKLITEQPNASKAARKLNIAESYHRAILGKFKKAQPTEEQCDEQ